MNYLWCSIKWLFADPFIPTDELELIEIALNYNCKFEKYRYFLDYERKFGIDVVRGFWNSALPWVKDLEEDGNGNWVPAKKEIYYGDVGESALPYYYADAICKRIFFVKNRTIKFCDTLDHDTKQKIIEHVKTHWIGGITI